MSQKKDYILSHYHVYVHKDNYEEGETDLVGGWNADDGYGFHSLSFDSREELMHHIKQIVSSDTDYDGEIPDDYFLIETDASETTIDTSILCKYVADKSGRGYDRYSKATEGDIEKWKKDELQLYSVGFTFIVNVYEPRVIAEFSKGGETDDKFDLNYSVYTYDIQGASSIEAREIIAGTYNDVIGDIDKALRENMYYYGNYSESNDDFMKDFYAFLSIFGKQIVHLSMYAKGGELMDADTEFEYGKGAKLQRCGLTEKSLFNFINSLLRKKKFLEVGLKREGGLPVQDDTWAQYSLLNEILEDLDFYSYDDYAKGGKTRKRKVSNVKTWTSDQLRKDLAKEIDLTTVAYDSGYVFGLLRDDVWIKESDQEKYLDDHRGAITSKLDKEFKKISPDYVKYVDLGWKWGRGLSGPLEYILPGKIDEDKVKKAFKKSGLKGKIEISTYPDETLVYIDYDGYYAHGGELMDADTEFEYNRGGDVNDDLEQLDEASDMVNTAANLVEDVVPPSLMSNYRAYGRYGFDQLLGKGNPYDKGLDDIGQAIEESYNYEEGEEYAKGGKIKNISEDIMKPFNVLKKVTFGSGGNTFHYMYVIADGTLVAFHTGTGDITISQPGMYDTRELSLLFEKNPYKEYSSEEKADEALDKFWDPKRLESKAVYEGVLYDNNLTPKKIEIIREKIGGKRFAKGGKVTNLKVTSIKYQNKRRGLAYRAKTNVKGVEIVNKGDGGATYLDGSWKDIKPYNNLDEWDLEELINVYEKVYAKGGKSDDNWIQDVTKEMEKDGTEGAFTKQAKRHKMTPIQFAKKVLKNPKKFSLKTRQRAQFVKNVNPEKFYEGGNISQVSKVGDPDYPNYEL